MTEREHLENVRKYEEKRLDAYWEEKCQDENFAEGFTKLKEIWLEIRAQIPECPLPAVTTYSGDEEGETYVLAWSRPEYYVEIEVSLPGDIDWFIRSKLHVGGPSSVGVWGVDSAVPPDFVAEFKLVLDVS